MLRVYISGPITKGCKSWNFYQAAVAEKKLRIAGFAVLNPMLSMAHMDAADIPWQLWIDSDLEFVKDCDLVIRLPGESKGADIETAFAADKHIPVMRLNAFEELDAWLAVQMEPTRLAA